MDKITVLRIFCIISPGIIMYFGRNAAPEYQQFIGYWAGIPMGILLGTADWSIVGRLKKLLARS